MRDGAVFAEPVADRADEELHRAVGERIGGDDDRGGADGGAEVGRDLRQQRVGDAHHGLAGEARDREQDDRARGIVGCGGGEAVTRAFGFIAGNRGFAAIGQPSEGGANAVLRALTARACGLLPRNRRN